MGASFRPNSNAFRCQSSSLRAHRAEERYESHFREGIRNGKVLLSRTIGEHSGRFRKLGCFERIIYFLIRQRITYWTVDFIFFGTQNQIHSTRSAEGNVLCANHVPTADPRTDTVDTLNFRRGDCWVRNNGYQYRSVVIKPPPTLIRIGLRFWDFL